ncbi:unnamed protein product [Amoebophrya sp. A25]|nr:unnamed protein product [Amoebophrya sp. A25]|eukprot:GSA25T00026835001.1
MAASVACLSASRQLFRGGRSQRLSVALNTSPSGVMARAFASRALGAGSSASSSSPLAGEKPLSHSSSCSTMLSSAGMRNSPTEANKLSSISSRLGVPASSFSNSRLLLSQTPRRRSFATATADPSAFDQAQRESTTPNEQQKEAPSSSSKDSSSSDKASSSGGDSGSSGSENSGGDKNYEEYDTQSAEKRVGNPIAWANPMAGPTLDDHSSPRWRNVYPIGAALILLGCLWSRRKNLKKKREEEELLEGSSVDLAAAGARNVRFSAPPSS